MMGYEVDPVIVDQAIRMSGAVQHVATPIAATPWQDVPALYERLPATSAGQCCRFLLLTLVRVHAGAGLRLGEVDLDAGVWTVPSDRVKGSENGATNFRVPLSGAAMALIADQRNFFDDVLFPGPRGQPIKDFALKLCLDRLGETGRPHGFRTSFRTWVQDTDSCSWEVSETVLGHQIGGRVERSYARSDMLDRRRIVMEAWARFVTGRETEPK